MITDTVCNRTSSVRFISGFPPSLKLFQRSEAKRYGNIVEDQTKDE